MKTRLGFVLILLPLALTGCVDRTAQEQAKQTEAMENDQTIPVTVGRVESRTLYETLEISGQITTADDVMIGAKQGGKIVSVYVREGDSVKAGALIASLDRATLQAQYQAALANVGTAQAQLGEVRSSAALSPRQSAAAVAQSEAQLRSAKAQLAKAREGARPQERRQAELAVQSARSDMETARKELDRAQQLYDDGAIAQQRLEQANNAYQNALARYENALQSLDLVRSGTREEDLRIAEEAVRQAEEGVRSAKAQKDLDVLLQDRVRAAESQVKAAQAQVDIARQALSDAEIRAPFSGRIAGQPVQPGTVVAPGTPVARLINTDAAYFEGQVPEEALASVKVGDVVQVTIDSLGGRTFSGKVASVSPMGTEFGRLFQARIALDDAPGLRAGLFARGRVTLRPIPGAAVVPADALVQRGDRSYVYTTVGEGGALKAKEVLVTPGLRDDGMIEVEGIEVGAPIVIRGQAGLTDGAAVRRQEQGS